MELRRTWRVLRKRLGRFSLKAAETEKAQEEHIASLQARIGELEERLSRASGVNAPPLALMRTQIDLLGYELARARRRGEIMAAGTDRTRLALMRTQIDLLGYEVARALRRGKIMAAGTDRSRSDMPRPSILAHDADWQYPAITEQHALRMMRCALSAVDGPNDTVYLGFPFATLIDLANGQGMKDPRTIALLEHLDALSTAASGYGRVISVCQHIHARHFEGLFERAGVTDLFWSHKIAGEDRCGATNGVVLHPFPIYPVQQVPRGRTDQARRRKWLFSFVGSRPNEYYLTQVRSWIIEDLSSHPDGLIVDRDEWHYNKLVYDLQIGQRTTARAEDLTSEEHEQVFREVLDESVFTLCPSGSGPNSIRLWEAIVNGSIPVVLSDTWEPPGPAELWDAAILRIPEQRTTIQEIPRIAAEIAVDAKRLAAMREAVSTLCELYGPDRFVPDIVALFPVWARTREPETTCGSRSF